MAVIGVDLGGTKLAAALFSTDGNIVHKEIVPLDNRDGDAVGELTIRQIRNLLGRAAEDHMDVEAVGVSVPGIYYAATGKVWAPNIPGWDEYPLLARLEAQMDDEISVRIDSDRACYILGETWQGSARGCRHAIFIAVGTGIGAGIMIDGKVLRGYGDIAGAIGWLALDRPYHTKYDTCGCFEYHASGTGIATVARAYLSEHTDYTGPLRMKDHEKITSRDIFEALAAGDTLAKKVVDESIAFWGMAVANLVSLFNPEQVIFGGGVFGPAAQFLDQIRAEALRWAQPISMRQVTLKASSLGGDAGLYGAGRLALFD